MALLKSVGILSLDGKHPNSVNTVLLQGSDRDPETKNIRMVRLGEEHNFQEFLALVGEHFTKPPDIP